MKTSKRLTSIAQGAVLMALFAVSLAALMAEPKDDSSWLITLVITKAAAAAGFYTLWKLQARWCDSDELGKAYAKDCDKALEAENTQSGGKEGRA